jgi:hypothetical protein
MKKEKKADLWRIIAAVISGLYIIYLWSSKDIEAAAGSENMLPIIVTSILVAAAKLALLAGAILLIKWLSKKFKKSK